MKFSRIYRAVVSLYPKELLDQFVLTKDILDAINESLANIRVEYVNRGMGQFFSTNETIQFQTDDTYIQYNSVQLTKPLLPTSPINLAILNLFCANFSRNITNAVTVTATEGEIVAIGDSTYICVESHNSVNSVPRKFKSNKIKNYKPGNELTYQQGDVFKDDSGYWLVNVQFISDGEEIVTEGVNFTKLYWRHLEDKQYYPGSFIEWKRLGEMILFPQPYPAYTVVKDKVYTTRNIVSGQINYVPEWEYVSSLDEDVELPEDAFAKVVTRAKGYIDLRFPNLGGSNNE
jgi:hypothetical protein